MQGTEHEQPNQFADRNVESQWYRCPQEPFARRNNAGERAHVRKKMREHLRVDPRIYSFNVRAQVGHELFGGRDGGEVITKSIPSSSSQKQQARDCHTEVMLQRHSKGMNNSDHKSPTGSEIWIQTVRYWLAESQVHVCEGENAADCCREDARNEDLISVKLGGGEDARGRRDGSMVWRSNDSAFPSERVWDLAFTRPPLSGV
ncbi:hypothetical protein BDD12DRAFT_983681 [Trichophaea hybrida]|nr:hypothetical protein BDD12DRAFT_983681 [Trichophaea hybrida]